MRNRPTHNGRERKRFASNRAATARQHTESMPRLQEEQEGGVVPPPSAEHCAQCDTTGVPLLTSDDEVKEGEDKPLLTEAEWDEMRY